MKFEITPRKFQINKGEEGKPKLKAKGGPRRCVYGLNTFRARRWIVRHHHTRRRAMPTVTDKYWRN